MIKLFDLVWSTWKRSRSMKEQTKVANKKPFPSISRLIGVQPQMVIKGWVKTSRQNTAQQKHEQRIFKEIKQNDGKHSQGIKSDHTCSGLMPQASRIVFSK